ncbi:TetR/AcrR family transcriptional regulator [Mumia zhuanghuii]|uniref:TetR/AcrR family transcriptional regulator n=2 Tax=Mumia TaxID=1546255 RepID=A0ABW1QHG5_9ACTN|nr:MULTISPECIES: TetR/AcrR family transcriptional regulator [Mumia]KAA1422818.1 TetR/AcrR family transcriptional regulator [Mumia zhuanghuii]
MGRSTKAQSAINRAHLVDLACELFAERGYESVGLDDVAAAAGQTRGAVYHHFGSKRGLFLAALTQAQEAVAHVVAEAAAATTDPWDALVAGCHAFLDAAADDSVRRILLVDGPSVVGWQEWRELDAVNSRRLLEEGLRELEAHGDLDDGSAAALAVTLSGAMNEAALWTAEAGGRTRAEAHAALTAILGGLRREGRPAARPQR